MDKQIAKLNHILMSSNVLDEFYKLYGKDTEFTMWLDGVMPEVDRASKQEQNNPWHKYNVLNHILHSVEEMNKLSVGLNKLVQKRLAYVMFLHDMGKPATHIVRNKNGKIIDSFFNHNIESNKIAMRVLPKLGFDQKEIDIIAKLVYKHDIFMFISDGDDGNPYHKPLNISLVNDEILDLNSVGDGKELLRELVMVGRADNLAQNEKMTAGSLKLLEKFDNILDKM